MKKTMFALQNEPEEKTCFDAVDLTIRQRVLALKAAVELTPVEAPIADGLLANFSREVENLESQLGQVEQQWGKNTPMARVLREAIESAKCRRDTRRIELNEDKVEAILKEEPVFKKPCDSENRQRALLLLVFFVFPAGRLRHHQHHYGLALGG